jgi:pimeloyl-ACP methyl ester carboxylesterase
MGKFPRVLLVLILFLLFAYFAGPKPEKPEFSHSLKDLSLSLDELERFLQEKEQNLPVKPENQSMVIWANDSLKNKTAYCLLYLHGFSASPYEGYPTHVNFARHFRANAYLPRLASHGLDVPEPLQDMTPDHLYESAKEALQIANLLGEKVMVMGTSTGGTLALKLAVEFPEMVGGLILLSPNIRINNPAAFLLSKPWGLQIGRLANGGNYRQVNKDLNDKECQYWNCFYRVEAIVYLQQLVESTMNKKLFKQVKKPVFLGYYYEDEEHQDEVVRVDAMLKMFEQLGTPENQKQKQAFNAGFHVIGCEMFSKTQPEVEQACIAFAEEVF